MYLPMLSSWPEHFMKQFYTHYYLILTTHSSFFTRFYLFIFRERGKEREREEEKHQCVVSSHAPPAGDLACNPGMCLDWESNEEPLVLQALLSSKKIFLKVLFIYF